MIHQAMWLTAGLGTRMRPFTLDCPKPFLPLWGQPLAHWTLDQLQSAGIRNITCNRHWLPEVFDARLRSMQDQFPALAIQVSDEASLLLGSAGGVRHALDRFGDRAFVWVNGDTWGDFDLKLLMDAHQKNRDAHPDCDVTLGLRRIPTGATYREFECHADGLVQERSSREESGLFFCGVAVMEPRLFRAIPDGVPGDLFPALLRDAIQLGRVRGLVLNNSLFFDLGAPKDWLHAHDAIAANPLMVQSTQNAPNFRSVGAAVWAQCPDEVTKVLTNLQFTENTYIYWDSRFTLPPAGGRLYYSGHWVSDA